MAADDPVLRVRDPLARQSTTISADYKTAIAGAELAAVKAVAPGRKDSMVAAAEANGDYHVRVTGIVADLGILGGEIKLEATKAKASSVTSWLGSAAQGLWDAATNVVGVLSKAYDVISLGAHTLLGVGGMAPVVGGLFDLADLALTAVELPFGKSDRSDLALATLSIATTAVPGPVDMAAGGGKIWVRVGKIGGKIADGIAAAGKGLDELGSAGRSLVAPRSGGGLVPTLQGNIPQADKWIRNGGRVIYHTDGSVTHIKNGVSIRYNSVGYPDFSKQLYQGTEGLNQVRIKLTGSRRLDEAAAKAAAGFRQTPDGFTWHHHEDIGLMQLVDERIHGDFWHSGGFSLSK